MAENNGLYSIQGSTLTDIADAIREKSGDTQRYAPSEMAAAVLAIRGEGGGGVVELPENLAYIAEESDDVALMGGEVITIDKEGAIEEPINPIFLALYPIGSIYMSVTYFDPATVFGGIWERIQDTFLLAAGSSYSAGATGGEATHKLTVSEMPSHTHTSYGVNDGASVSTMQGNYPVRIYQDRAGNWTTNASNATGGNAAHNNMPPYLAVYMWQRIA